MRKIDLHRSVDKFLAKLTAKHSTQLTRKLDQLTLNPLPHDSAKLTGTEIAYFRVDVGEYRIIYRYDDATIYVDTVGKRNDGDVYKQFKRKH